MHRTRIPYAECRHLIHSADILLFQHRKFPHPSWWVAKYGQTKYSHVGLANWSNGQLRCVEFRMSGVKNELLQDSVEREPGRIDVFRPPKIIYRPKIELDENTMDFVEKIKGLEFNKTMANNIISTALSLQGKSYAWRIIGKIVLSYAPFFRLWQDKRPIGATNLFVCSTLVNYAYRQHYTDLCPFLSDEFTQPADIARSSLLSYMFTIQ